MGTARKLTANATSSSAGVVRETAGELARRIESGEVSSVEVVEAHIERIQAVDDSINAVVLRRFDAARKEAERADRDRAAGGTLGPLHGVPVTIKDQFHVAGLPTTFGVARLRDVPAVRDGFVAGALRDAGAIVLGKTNVPQVLYSPDCVNDPFGATKNPWDLERTPGGSSGGDAAIVAAAGSPLSIGADHSGSLRLPAAWCGLFTVKPTSRRLPTDPLPIQSAAGLEGLVAQPGPICRSVADAELALRVLVEANVTRGWGTFPPVPWREPSAVDVSGLRVAVVPEMLGWTSSPAIRRSIDRAADLLRDAGATVDEWEDLPDLQPAMEILMALLVSDGMGWARELIGGDPPHALVKPDLQMMRLPNWALRLLPVVLRWFGQERMAGMAAGLRKATADELMCAMGRRAAYERTFLDAMDRGRYDVVLCSATPVPATPFGLAAELADAWGPLALFNALGMPAGIVPVSRVRPGEESDRAASKDGAFRAAAKAEEGSAGLPTAVQLAARHWREDVLLAVMYAMESRLTGDDDFPPDVIRRTGPDGVRLQSSESG